MKKSFLIGLVCVVALSAAAWTAPYTEEVSADAYLRVFMQSDIDCAVIIYDATHGDWGFSDSKKKDNYSRCSPAREIKKIRVRNSDGVREGMRSDTYFNVNTTSFIPEQRRKQIEGACQRRENPKGVMYTLWTQDAEFTVVSLGGLGKDWADSALYAVERYLGGLRACTFLATYPSFGKRVEPTPTKSSAKSKKITPTPKATSNKSNIETTIVCLIDGKTYKIVGVNPKCPPSGNTNKSSAPSTKPSASTISEADKFAKMGCSAFPSAILRLQNASGATYNKAVVAAQDASFYIIDAAQLDSRYEGLRNAQRIIAQYVQDVGWGGKGYAGDVNTVRTALATFNMACNSNLKIG